MGRSSAAVALAAALVTTTVWSGAVAATVGHWADLDAWAPTADGRQGTTVTFSGTTGFGDVTARTDGPSPARPTGATTWLGAWTPPGAVYGSSRDRPYLNLRPAGASPTAPSTTTYTFDGGSSGGWTFVLGDIDAEFLDVSATDVDGAPVDVADLGFRSAFNYCTGTPRPSCSPTKATPDPLWDAVAGRLSGPEVDAAGAPIPGWSDTDGAAAWFEPTTSLGTLTVQSTWRTGSPTYQTWFAALTRDATGTVTGADGCAVGDLDVVLRAGDDVVERTTTAADGTWSFDGLALRDDWTVEVVAPDDCGVTGEARRTVDLSDDDAVVDTALVADDPTDPVDPTDPTGPTVPTDPVPPGAGSGSGSGVGAGGATPGDVAGEAALPDTGGQPVALLALGASLLATGVVVLAGRAVARRGVGGRH